MSPSNLTTAALVSDGLDPAVTQSAYPDRVSTRPPLSPAAATEIADALTDHGLLPHEAQHHFIARQTNRYIPRHRLADGVEFVRGAWTRGRRSGETWQVTGAKPRLTARINAALRDLQATHIGADLDTLPLTAPQWQMLEALFTAPATRPPVGSRRETWVPTDGFDRRTWNSLLARGLVMDYPHPDRALGHLTPDGRTQVSAHLRHQRRERAGRIEPGRGYR